MIHLDVCAPPGPRPGPAAGATARTRQPERAGPAQMGRRSHPGLTVLEPS